MNEDYIEDLCKKLREKKINVLKQKGISDIENLSDEDDIQAWYSQIEKYINQNPPINYVSSLQIFFDSSQMIVDIKYIFGEKEDFIEQLSLNLFWT